MTARSRTVVASALALLLIIAPVRAQRANVADAAVAPEFDAAAVRMVTSRDGDRSTSRFTPGRYIANKITLRELIRGAYALSVIDQVRGGPAWLDSARFDVQATAPDTTPEQMRGMLRRLLSDRFALKVTLATEDWPTFALTLTRPERAREALKVGGCQALSDSVPKDLCGNMVEMGQGLSAYDLSMARFAVLLSRSPRLTGADRLVTDETGLPGAYSFQLRFAQPPRMGLRIPDTTGLPEFTTALQEQLGLALTPTRAPTLVVIVEGAAMPGAN